jgi:hypothetical protein
MHELHLLPQNTHTPASTEYNVKGNIYPCHVTRIQEEVIIKNCTEGRIKGPLNSGNA